MVMGNSSNKALLKKIDDHDGSKSLAEMSKLFAHYDKDKSGVLEGQEFKSLLDDLTEYFFAKVEAQHPGTHNKEQVWNWLKAWLDPNSDNRCEKFEMEANLKKLMERLQNLYDGLSVFMRQDTVHGCMSHLCRAASHVDTALAVTVFSLL